MATVTVRGEATVRTEPDEALLWVTLSALDAEPGAALADITARSRELVRLLDELGVVAADRSTSGVSVREEFDHTKDGRRSLGHRAAAVTAVRRTDPELIGRLISRAAADLGAQVAGPQWQIAPDNPARLEAARQAAADGQRRAQAYAEGVGARLGQLMELSEPEDQRMPVAARRAMSQPAGGEPIPVQAGEQEVAASVRVTFALELDRPVS
jgi:hypothetical protein